MLIKYWVEIDWLF